MQPLKVINLSVASFLACLSQPVSAITAEELQQRMEEGEKLTIIDVRNLHNYQNNHIPGAINIPAQIMPNKKLPPLGHVVVYGDGIHNSASEIAVDALNQKNGIQAELLEGGIAAWQSLGLSDSRPAGMKQASKRYISYQNLIDLIPVNSDIILVDLRQKTPGKILADIEEQMPGVPIIRPVYRKKGKSKKAASYQLKPLMRRWQKGQTPPLYVLIDNGDEMSEKVYRRLQASRIKRVAILVGGELILSRHGESGEQTQISGERQ